MIDPREFTDEMEKYWSEKLGNVPSEALRKVWFQLAKVFGRYAIGKTHRNEWTVLQPPTGSGKTQGTIVYCSMLPKVVGDSHPGVLIVTRLKTDADQIAEKINELSGNKDEAVAYHSDTKDKLKITDLKNYPACLLQITKSTSLLNISASFKIFLPPHMSNLRNSLEASDAIKVFNHRGL
jgi:Lhr-like helicase